MVYNKKSPNKEKKSILIYPSTFLFHLFKISSDSIWNSRLCNTHTDNFNAWSITRAVNLKSILHLFVNLKVKLMIVNMHYNFDNKLINWLLSVIEWALTRIFHIFINLKESTLFLSYALKFHLTTSTPWLICVWVFVKLGYVTAVTENGISEILMISTAPHT